MIEQLYQVALGPTGAGYYAKRFKTFESLGRTRPGWNWAAALCTLGWLAYRKLWVAALAYAAIVPGLVIVWAAVLRPLLALPVPIEVGLGLVLALFSYAIPGLWGDMLVYDDVHKRTIRALELAPTIEHARTQLEQQAPTKRHQFVIAAAHIALAAVIAAAIWMPAAQPVEIVTTVEHQASGIGEMASAASQPSPPIEAPPASPTLPASEPIAPIAPVTSNVNAAGTTIEPRVLTAGMTTASASQPISPPMIEEHQDSSAMPDAAPPPPVLQPAIVAPTGGTTAAVAAIAAVAGGTTAAVMASKHAAPTHTKAQDTKATATSSKAQKAQEKAQTKAQEKAREKDKAKEKAKEKASAKALAKKSSKAQTAAQTKPAVGKPDRAKPAATVVQTLEAQRYYINVATFSNAAHAKKTQQRLQRMGLPVVVQSTTTNKGERVRVRSGPFEKEESERHAQRLRAMGLEAVVFQSR